MELISLTDGAYWSLHAGRTGLLGVQGFVRQLSDFECTCSLLGMLRYELGSLTHSSPSLESPLKCHLISKAFTIHST